MTETTVGIRELKNNLTVYLNVVRVGSSLIVADRKHAVARLEPGDADISPAERVRQLRDAGLLIWRGEKLSLDPVEPMTLRENVLASDLVLEDRE